MDGFRIDLKTFLSMAMPYQYSLYKCHKVNIFGKEISNLHDLYIQYSVADPGGSKGSMEPSFWSNFNWGYPCRKRYWRVSGKLRGMADKRQQEGLSSNIKGWAMEENDC